MEDTARAPARERYFVLFLLILVYTLNFLDRQILSILAVPIKAEFHLDDSHLGLLGGLAFGLVYSVLAIPAAWLADRYSRTWIIAGGLALWSGFTALCGAAMTFPQLFMARMGVGIGEAGGPPAYSLICDYFPPKTRARAIAIYSFGIPLGSAAGILFGGYMAAKIDWRFAFIAMGLAGLAFAPLFRLLVREPKRDAAADAAPGMIATARSAFAKPAFWLLSFGAGSASLVGYGLMFWLPSFLVRTLGLSLIDTSKFLAAVLFFGGVAGMLLGGWLADRLGQKRRAAYPLIPAIAFLVSTPLYVAAVTMASQNAFWLFVGAQALGLVWLGPIATAVQHLGPANTRSQTSALFLLINNLIGLGVGPWFFGHMSDYFKPDHGVESIKYAFISGLGFYVLAAGLLILAATRMKKDWHD